MDKPNIESVIKKLLNFWFDNTSPATDMLLKARESIPNNMLSIGMMVDLYRQHNFERAKKRSSAKDALAKALEELMDERSPIELYTDYHPQGILRDILDQFDLSGIAELPVYTTTITKYPYQKVIVQSRGGELKEL